MQAIISSIIEQLKLDNDQITNIFNYGSWVYGTNHEKSDRDFLIIMKVENKDRRRLKFRKDFDYFHSFKLHRLKNYDITIHSCENFELLLEKNYMLAVECLFYPSEFILRNNIDYKTIYLSKYYNPLRIKRVICYENSESLKLITDNEQNHALCSQSKSKDNSTIDKFLCDALNTTTKDEDKMLKYLFHGLRYLDIGEQLIRTKSIYDFKRVSYVLVKMREIYISNNKDINAVIDYISSKSDEYKIMINELVSTNIIHGTFQVHLTVENYDMEKFLHVCATNKLKPIFIHLNNGNHRKQVMASFYHDGTYPDIIEEIKTLIDIHFEEFNVIRVKIKSLISNHGLPDNDIDRLFWSERSNYFEFHYKVLIKSAIRFKKLEELCANESLHLAFNAFKKTSIHETYYFVTMRLFDVGKTNATIRNNHIIRYLTCNHYPPVKVEEGFIIYDSNISLDSGWGEIILDLSKTSSFSIDTRSKCRVGFKNRKPFDRSTT